MVLRVRLLSSLGMLFLTFASGCKPLNDKSKVVTANADTLQLKVTANVFYYKGRPFSGKRFRLGSSASDTLSIEYYSEGKKHGKWTRYYKNKRLMEQRFYVHGSKEGEHSRYWPNGQKLLSYQLKNDVYHGNSKAWNSSGRLVSDRNFINGHEAGHQRIWYDNGIIKSNYIVKNNRRYGLLGTKNCSNVTDSIFK